MEHVVAVLAACAVASVAASVPQAQAQAQALRGVPRSLYARYEGRTFTCDGGALTLPIAEVNDDFCRCADGSDEPGTAACANSRFYCANKGYRGKYVPSMYVGDGHCDCCDGSEERAGRCPNTCEADGASWRLAQAEAIRKAEEGAARRQQYVQAGAEAARVRRARVAELAARGAQLASEREAAERALEVEEAKEHEETERRALAAANGAGPTPDPEEEQEVVAAAPAPVAAAPAAPTASAAAQLGLEHSDKEAVLALLVEHVRSTGTAEALLATLRGRVADGTLLGVASDFAPAFPAPAVPSAVAVPTATPTPLPAYKSDQGDRARDKLASAKADEGVVTAELATLAETEAADFGPDGAFFQLKNGGACLELKVNQYNYKVCPFGRAEQDGTLLGTFSAWSKRADGSTDYTSMLHENGAMCWNGPARSLKLLLECGATDALLSIDEPNKCAYEARLQTPAACDGRAAKELRMDPAEHEQEL